MSISTKSYPPYFHYTIKICNTSSCNNPSQIPNMDQIKSNQININKAQSTVLIIFCWVILVHKKTTQKAMTEDTVIVVGTLYTYQVKPHVPMWDQGDTISLLKYLMSLSSLNTWPKIFVCLAIMDNTSSFYVSNFGTYNYCGIIPTIFMSLPLATRTEYSIVG